MNAKKEPSARFLALRAALVIAVVLSLLMGLKKAGVLTSQFDLPAQVVQETMGIMDIAAE